MADRGDVINQLSDCRQAACGSTDKHHEIINQEVANPVSDPAVLATCTTTIAQNDKTIQSIDGNIVDAILNRPDTGDFLTTLITTTDTMKHQTAALTDDLAVLNCAKTVATALAGVLALAL